jgi:hypothetical protein
MTLYTSLTLGVNRRWTLDDPLTMDMATYLRRFDVPVPGTKLEHLGVMSRALIGTLVNQPTLPWGLITDLAGVFDTSRETIYTIGRRIREGVLVRPNGRRPVQVDSPATVDPQPYPTINVTICELILEAGERAGRKLDEINLSALGQVVTARDELYFSDLVFLINVEPRHFVIVGGYVEEQCDSKTWGVALQLDHHTRGLQIIGLAEDGATMYPASIREAELSLQVQKDVWHIESKARQAVTDLERVALKAMERAYDLLCQIIKDGAQDDDDCLAEWVPADDKSEYLVDLSAQVRCLRGHLCDALELVDWRSGEIRSREINEWLLNQVLEELRALDHPRVRKLVKYLERQQDEMLTFLDLLEVCLAPWQRQLAQYLPDETQRKFFQSTVARAWRLNRAVANGHTSFRSEAEFATALMAELVADDPVAFKLAEALLNILEGVVRTSCAAEAINSILRPYLTIKRSFQSRKTAQAWLNLFCLWFNMHPLKRSKRRRGDQPMSPYQYAGVKVYTDDGRETLDWLESIGYPTDN